jgi:two-component system response regulator RegA
MPYPCVRPVHSVLLVDDDESVLSEYCKALHPRVVHGTTDAAVALELAREHKPDLALVDLRLENQPSPATFGLKKKKWRPLSGTDVVGLLRAEHADLRIVMISGGRAHSYSLEARDAGADGMLCKAYGPEKLIMIIEGDRLSDHDKQPVEPMSLRRKEHEYIAQVFVATGRNVSSTAKILEIERNTLKNKLQENINTTFDEAKIDERDDE